MPALFQAGGFAVPASIGTLDVIFDQPFLVGAQLAIFFGSNQPTEDAVVTAANAGAFMGMMVDDGAGGILAQATAQIPGGGQRASGSHAILMTSTFNAIEYSAQPVSFALDRLTIDFDAVVQPRHIHYLVVGDADNLVGFQNNNAILDTVVGFLAKTMFHVGTLYTGGGNGDWIRPDLGGYLFGWWGGAAHPPAGGGNHRASSLSVVDYPFTGQKAVRMGTDVDVSDPMISSGAGFIGPFLTEPQHHAHPTAPDIYHSDFTGGFQNMGLLGVWDADADADEFFPDPVAGNTDTHSLTLLDTIDAMILFTSADERTGPGIGSPDVALGFGVWTQTYQGCVLVDRTGNYLFQSRTKSWCANVDAAGALAGTIQHVEESGQFDVTTTDDGVPTEAVAWVGWVNGVDDWRPHIYRWVYSPPEP